jgi:hypothetical protein
MKLFYFLPSISLFFSLSLAYAQDFRCGSASRGGTHIVKTGESKADVLMKCGEPMMRDEAGSDTRGRFSTSTIYRGSQSTSFGRYKESTARVELWYYNCGEGKFNRVLEFHGGILKFIHRSDQRGKGLADWDRW